MIKNYTLKKTKNIFADGSTCMVDLYWCNSNKLEYRAIIKDNKVIKL